MGAFASVTLPLVIGLAPGASAVAQQVVADFPGTRNVALDATGTSITFELHFPGNLSALVSRLANNRIGVGTTATISVPTLSLAPELLASADAVHERLNEGAEVWDPEFTRGSYVSSASLIDGHVVATILPNTEAVHQVYDSMLVLGLTAVGPTPAAGVH